MVDKAKVSLFWLLTLLMIHQVLLKVIIMSDMDGEVIQDGTILMLISNSHQTGSEPGAVSIWGPQGFNVPRGQSFVFLQNFTVTCNKPITVLMNADDRYTAYINGIEILRTQAIALRSVTKSLPELNIRLNRENTLKIEASDVWGGSAGLFYQIIQEDCISAVPFRQTINPENTVFSIDNIYPLLYSTSRSGTTPLLFKNSQPQTQKIAHRNIRSTQANIFDAESQMYEYEQQNRAFIKYYQLQNSFVLLHFDPNIHPYNQVYRTDFKLDSNAVEKLDTGVIFQRCEENSSGGILEVNGVYMAGVGCVCGGECYVDIYRMTNKYKNTTFMMRILGVNIQDNLNIKVLKLSRNADTLALLTKASPTSTTLQTFKLDMSRNTSTRTSVTMQSYQQSQSYFVLTSTSEWRTNIIYAAIMDDKTILRSIDQNGNDTVLYDFGQVQLHSLRFYGSGNGRYIGVVRQDYQENYDIQMVSRFEMFQVKQMKEMGYQAVPQLSFIQIGRITSLQIDQYGGRISYIKQSQKLRQLVTISHTVGKHETKGPCENSQYSSIFPEECQEQQKQSQNQVNTDILGLSSKMTIIICVSLVLIFSVTNIALLSITIYKHCKQRKQKQMMSCKPSSANKWIESNNDEKTIENIVNSQQKGDDKFRTCEKKELKTQQGDP